MLGVRRLRIIYSLVILSLVFSPIFSSSITTITPPEPYFSIGVLAPNTSSSRVPNYSLYCELLPRIGIEVEIFDHTGWSKISPRTWGYPGPYPIPTYAEGGYDILFVGWQWDFTLDFKGFFDSPSITPDGDNFYQYSNINMDWAIENYSQAYSPSSRDPLAKEIQALLYEDLPSIPLVYPLEFYACNESLVGWNPVLWHNNRQMMNNWSITGKTELDYCIWLDLNQFHPFECDADDEDYTWLHQMYTGLLERDPLNDNSYSPWLAESYNTPDGLTYYVIIKKDACWADGINLTTDDVIYNYQLAVTPSFGSSSFYAHNSLYWDNNSITKINDKEFSITFKQGYNFQVDHLALPLIPKHIWNSIDPSEHKTKAEEWFSTNPENIFGAGPYRLNDSSPTSFLLLEKNEHFVDWYEEEQGFDTIRFKFIGSLEESLIALTAGTVDILDSSIYIPQDEFPISGIATTVVPSGATTEIAINMQHPYLGTGEYCPIAGPESAKHIRKAMSYLFPRELACLEYYHGLAVPAATIWNPISTGYDESLEPLEHNIGKAIEEMGLAGFDTSWTVSTGMTAITKFTIGLSVSISGLVLAFLIGGIVYSRKE